MEYLLLGILLLVFVSYFWAQFLTTYYEKHFYVIVALLIAQATLGFSIFFIALYNREVFPTKYLGLLLWSIVTLSLSVTKLVAFNDLNLVKSKKITRQRTEVGLEHDDFCVFTQDGVPIRGYHIHMQAGRTEVLILCHGAGKSKNAFETMGLAQWLAHDFDVIGFDARGHYESGGQWGANSATKLDLLAVSKYAKECGYKKVGLIGRSLGGWTALLFIHEYGDVDSLILLAAPFGEIRDTPQAKKLFMFNNFGTSTLIRAVHGLRYKPADVEDNGIGVLEIMSQLKIPIFLIYSEQDMVAGVSKKDVYEAYNLITSSKKRMKIFSGACHLPETWHLGPLYLMCKDWFFETL